MPLHLYWTFDFMTIYDSILDLIGHTPLVRINKLNPYQNVEILAKLESFNPGGSIKDRIGLTMIEGGERDGRLKKGGKIVEATSGNTGISLAMSAAVKGYDVTFTMPDWMSQDKENILRAYGAEVLRCPTAVPIDDPRGYKTTAKRIAKEEKAFLPDQYSNPDNPRAHSEGTGPEIWADTEGKLDAISIGIGTGGTATGTVKYLKSKNKQIQFYAPDPIGSIYSGEMAPFFVEGIGHIFFPENVDLSLVDKFVRIDSKAAIQMAIRLAKEEGILAGPSCGAAMLGALEAAKALSKKTGKHRVVAIFPDSGERYLKYMNDQFEIPLPPRHETKKGFATAALHTDVKDFQEKNALVPPVARSANYTFDSHQEIAKIFKGSYKAKDNRSKYLYARGNHPNQRQLELTVTKLESGTDAVAFASGMAAISAMAQTLLQQGDHVVASNVLYGDSFHLFANTVKKWGVSSTFVEITDLAAVKKAITKKTRLLYFETPTNPLLTIADISKLSEIAHAAGVLVVIDNTFASPYLQQPLKLGADIVVCSSTKYLSGHSDALGGLVVSNDQDFIMQLWGTLFVTGGLIDPEAAWLTQRGIKTLALRMERQCASAMQVARFLESHPKVTLVHYPGLQSHPQHDLARTQMNGFGGILSFEVKGGVAAGKRFVNALNLFALSVSLGAVESLVNHPASMTHSIIPRADRLKGGITDGLIRLSIGIEDVEDIIADVEQALEKV